MKVPRGKLVAPVGRAVLVVNGSDIFFEFKHIESDWTGINLTLIDNLPLIQFFARPLSSHFTNRKRSVRRWLKQKVLQYDSYNCKSARTTPNLA